MSPNARPASRRGDPSRHVGSSDESPSKIQTSIEQLISLYEAWHTAEPGKGYDSKAAEWRAKLPQPDTDDDRSPDQDGPTTQEESKQSGDD